MVCCFYIMWFTPFTKPLFKHGLEILEIVSIRSKKNVNNEFCWWKYYIIGFSSATKKYFHFTECLNNSQKAQNYSQKNPKMSSRLFLAVLCYDIYNTGRVCVMNESLLIINQNYLYKFLLWPLCVHEFAGGF